MFELKITANNASELLVQLTELTAHCLANSVVVSSTPEPIITVDKIEEVATGFGDSGTAEVPVEQDITEEEEAEAKKAEAKKVKAKKARAKRAAEKAAESKSEPADPIASISTLLKEIEKDHGPEGMVQVKNMLVAALDDADINYDKPKIGLLPPDGIVKLTADIRAHFGDK